MQYIVGAVGLAFLYVLWRAVRPRPVFALRVARGAVVVESGKPPPDFVRHCEEIVEQQAIENARIAGHPRQGGGISLRFSGVPESLHQRFRNAFVNS